jgi:hypothetical protein
VDQPADSEVIDEWTIAERGFGFDFAARIWEGVVTTINWENSTQRPCQLTGTVELGRTRGHPASEPRSCGMDLRE